MKTALVCTSRNLFKPGSGEYYKVKSIAFALYALGYDVSILTSSITKPSESQVWGFALIYQQASLFKALANFFRNFPTSIQRSIFASRISEGYDLVIYSLVRTVPYSPPVSQCFVDFADVLSINFRRIALNSFGPVSLLKYIESILLKYDERIVGNNYNVTLVSESEKRYCRIKGWRAHKLMQPAPLALNDSSSSIAHVQRKKLLFIGPNGYYPNHQALQWISDYIVPVLPPTITVEWVGRNDRNVQYHGIQSLGYVEDLVGRIRSCLLNLVPIVTATGIQNKLLDCLYLNANVITYKKISKIQDFPNVCNLHRASSSDEFIGLVKKIISSDFRNCNDGSVNENFGLSNFKINLLGIIDECTDR